MAFEDRTFPPLLQRCLTVIFSTLIVVFEMDFLFRHLNISSDDDDDDTGLLYSKLECGPMPNLMVALPNIGGALCSTPQSLADAHY